MIGKRVPSSKQGLEDYVMKYDHEVREAVERDPEARAVLRDVASRTYEKYDDYIHRGFWGGLAKKVGQGGRAVGYASDAYAGSTALRGFADLPVALGGKAIHLLAQIPDALYGAYYAVKSGHIGDFLGYLGKGVASYLPGVTVANRGGMDRVIKKRMAKQATYEVREKLGLNTKRWEERAAEEKERQGYTNVRPRTGNIVRVNFRDRERKVAA